MKPKRIKTIKQGESLPCEISPTGTHQIIENGVGRIMFQEGAVWDNIEIKLICKHCWKEFNLVPNKPKFSKLII